MATLKDIDKRVGQVDKLGSGLNLYIHETALMIARFAAPEAAGGEGNGDCTRAVKLVRAMPASMRREMLILWFATYTPIRIKLSDNGDKCEYDPAYKKLAPTEKPGKWELPQAAETAFYDIAKTVPEEKPFDLDAMVKMVESLTKRIEKKLEDNKVPEADVLTAQSLAITLGGIKVERIAPANDDKGASGKIAAKA